MRRRFSKRQESVLLKTSPARSFAEDPLGSPSSYSMVDFKDAFGRPPRRRYSLQSDVDGAVDERLGRSEADESVRRRRRSLWSGLRFWESSEEVIIKKPADEFFDDIFQGNQSDGAKMMRSDASSHCDSSVAPQFSVLAEMSKGMEVLNLGRSTDYHYPLSPAVLTSRPSRHGSPNPTHRTNEGDLTYHRRQVFVQFSMSKDGSVKILKTDKLEAEEIVKPNSVSSDSLVVEDVASDLPDTLNSSENIVNEISDVGKLKGMVTASSRFGSHTGKQGMISATSVTSSPEVSGRKKSVKEMVKEFVEMFNKESSSKSKMAAETLSQRSERNDKGSNKADGDVNVSAKKGGKGVLQHNLDDNEMFEIELEPTNTQKNLSSASRIIVQKPQVLDSSSTDEKKTSKATSTKVDLPDEKKMEPPKKVPQVDGHEEHEKQDSRKEQSIHVYKDSLLKHADASSSGSLLDIYQDANESFFDPMITFEIKELTQEQKMAAQTDEYQLALQDSDEKIRRWSSGKEGNIRSLLSTLQHVMWPGSGWKPVALTDIIEENQVKKTYQRALLCVHPDKLKQKSVGEVERYIGEKVFKILQEAWNFFNTLTPL